MITRVGNVIIPGPSSVDRKTLALGIIVLTFVRSGVSEPLVGALAQGDFLKPDLVAATGETKHL